MLLRYRVKDVAKLTSFLLLAPLSLPTRRHRTLFNSWSVSTILKNFHPRRRFTTYLMSDTGTESQRPRKRRRISDSPKPTIATASATESPERMTPSTPPPPQIQLSPIEQTLRLLLIDAAEYIQQNQNAGVCDTAGGDLTLRFTGGWVRDKLLGIDGHDIDVGISTMTGYQFGVALKDYLDIPGNLEKYRNHHPDNALNDVIGGLHKIAANPEKSKHLETVTTRIFGFDVDLVNLRKETYTEESRNPQMEFGTPVEDALRRDATVNALFYNLHTSQVEDFTKNGLRDMRDGAIRTPMPAYQTFKDDPLRVLRLIRFASRFGYTIDADTEISMQDDSIKTSLKAKISPERVGTEVEKMLRGPDPLRAVEIIHRLGLYDTIFANHQDDVSVDTSCWPLAYTTLEAILNDQYNPHGIPISLRNSVRDILVRDNNERFYSWIIAAFSPWSITTSNQTIKTATKKHAPRPSMVARDSLRCDNKIMNVLTTAANYHSQISDAKNAFLKGECGSLADTRWKLGDLIRNMGVDWRLCVVQSILIEIMSGKSAENVLRDYQKLLLFLEEQDLLDIHALRPIVNGREIRLALKAVPGPWMAKALETVIEWQIRNPERSDTEGAMAEIMKKKAELDFENKT